MDTESFTLSVSDFAQDIQELLDSCLPGSTVFSDPKLSGDTLRAAFTASKELKILPSGSKRASISFEYGLCTNSTGNHLAVERSSFKIQYKAAKKFVPIVRIEYERNARNKPVSHFQVHADSVPLGLLLARGGQHDKAAQQQDVHFPMGGHRYRVCAEDMIELMIREFNVEPLEGWEQRVEKGRQDYRAKQEETVIRKNLPKAIKILKELGFNVDPPADFHHAQPSFSTEW